MPRTEHFRILTLILFTLPFLGRLIIDKHKIKDLEQKITRSGYISRDILTGLAILAVAVLNKLLIAPNPYLWTGVAYSLSIFVALFDYSLNLERERPFFYVSPDAAHPSYWERWRQNVTPLSELVIKIFLLSAGISSYYEYTLL